MLSRCQQRLNVELKGQTCIIIASGPSLALEHYSDLKIARDSGLPVIVVNSTIEVAPWADAIYAADIAWWRYNQTKVIKSVERWTGSESAATLYKCKYHPIKVKPGHNSGANAIELIANVFKSPRILLLGFDVSVELGVHHHQDHKNSHNPSPERCAKWHPQFRSVKELIGSTEIINCSRFSALSIFPRMQIEEAILK